MLYERKYISLNGRAELIALKPSNLTEVADDTSVLLDNQVSYNTNEKALHIKKSASSLAFFDQLLGSLEIGDNIRVQAEYYHISGARPFETLIKGNLSGTYANVDFVQARKSNEWETLNFNWIVQEDNTYAIRLGLSASQPASEFKIRDVRIELMTKTSDAKKYRTAFFKKVNGTFTLDDSYAYDECEITQTADSLKVVFAKPLSKKGLAFTNQPYYTVSNNYIVRVAYSSSDTVYITFWSVDEGTGSALQISTIPDNADLSIMLVG